MIRRLFRARRARIGLLLAGLLGLGWGTFETVARSEWLGDRVRVSIVERIEAATGGTVSIERLRFGARRLDFEIEGLSLETDDDPDTPPLVTVPRASVRVGLRSFLGGRTHLEALRLHSPRLRVSVGDGGSSNIPWRRAIAGTAGLAVDQIELTGGSIEWNGEPYGIEFSGTGLSIEAAFDPVEREYFIEATVAEPTWGSASGEALEGSEVEVSATASDRGVEIHGAAFRGESILIEVRDAFLGLSAPSAEGRFSAEADLAAAAAFLRTGVPGLAGMLSATGEVRWSAGNRELDYRAEITVREAGAYGLNGLGPFECSVEGNFDRLALTGFQGSLLGGTLDGTVEVRDLGNDPQVSANGSAVGLSIASATGSLDMESIAWDGWLDLGIESSGTLSEGLVSDLEFGIQPSEDPSKLPVEGTGSIRHSGGDGTLAISDLRLTFGRGQATLRATGSISAGGDADLTVEAEFDSRTSLERLLAAARLGTALPEGAPEGQLAFHGDVRGTLGDQAGTVLDGEFSARDFRFAGEQWDGASFRGTATVAGIEIREGEVFDGDGRLSLHGTLPLVGGKPVEVQGSGQGFDAEKLGRASGFGLPIEGTVAIEARLSGTLENPLATSSIRVVSPRLFSESFDGMEADIRYDSGRFDLARAVVHRGESTLHVTGSVDQDTQEVTLDVATTRWQLDEFGLTRILAPGVAGAVEFGLTASGILGGARRLRAVELDGHWEVADLLWKDSDLGKWSGRVSSSRDRQNIDFSWNARTLGGTISGEAALWQTETPSYNGTVSFRDINAAHVWRALEFPEGALDGSITGSARFGGALGAPGTFEANGTVDAAELSIGPGQDRAFQVSNVFPMRWSIRDGAIRLDSMSLGGAETDFIIDGSVGVVGERELNLSLNGSVNLLLLQGLLPGTEWEGASRIGLQILGTLDNPSIEGSMAFEGAGLAPSEFPLRLSGLTGSIRFEDSEGRIENLVAASGGGLVRFDGVVAYTDTGLEYRLHALAEDIRVDYPGSMSSIMDGEFTLAGVGYTSILNGDLLISRMSIRSGVSFSDLFSSLDRPPANRVSSPVLQGMQLSLQIGAIPQLPVETDLVRNIATDLDLELVGTVASPSLLGTVGIVQGEIRMLGTHYQINRGDIRFLNPLQAEPVLDVELETRIRDTDLELVLSGPARSLDLSYRSDPPIPFHDLVSLIAVGKEPTVDPSIASQRRIQQQSLVQTGADALLSQAIAEPVDRRLQRFFGVSRIKVDPQIGGLEANPNPRILTEQQIGEEVTLFYSYDLSSAQQQSIRIEWNPDRRWSFLITRDQNGLVGSDILFKVRLP